MDKIKIANVIETLICRVLKAEKLLPDTETKADYKRGMEIACKYNGMEDEWKMLCDLKSEIEMDGLKVSKGGRSKQRATAIKKLSEDLYKRYADTRHVIAGVTTDNVTGKDVLMSECFGVMLNEKAPECAVKTQSYGKEGTGFSKFYRESEIKHSFELLTGEIETILKNKKAAAGKLWNSNGCTDKVVAFGTEDKSVQFKVNIANLFDVVKCIENDDRSFEMCFVKSNKGIIIKTDHGTGVVMPIVPDDDVTYENDYI